MQCRVCRRTHCDDTMDMSYVIPTDGKTLYDYFNDCTQLKATNGDELPKVLCTNCTQNLQQAYNFRQEARNSDEELKKVLTLAKNGKVMVCDPADGPTEVFRDMECSTHQLLTPLPKKETAFVYYSGHSTELENIETNTFDLPTDSTKKECSAYDLIEQPEVLEMMNASSIDPLSAITHIEQNANNSFTINSEEQNELHILKQEIKIELSNDMFEKDSNKYLLEPLAQDDNDDSSSDTEDKLQKNRNKKHKAPLICPQCCKVFDIPKEMELHIKLVHTTDTDMSCLWCKNSRSLPINELALHLQQQHCRIYYRYFPRLRIRDRESDPYQCERCPKFFASIDELANHVQEHKYDCPICSQSFKIYSSYSVHIRRKHKRTLKDLKDIIPKRKDDINGIGFNCWLCEKKLKSEKTLRLHISSKHKESYFESNNEKESTDNSIREQTHVNDKHTESYFESNNEKGSTDNIIRELTRIEDSEKSKTMPGAQKISDNIGAELVECKYCHKNLPAGRIDYHEKRHAYRLRQKGKFICSYCCREFNSAPAVKKHEQKVHLFKIERKECSICQKLIDVSYMKTHIAIVHNAERKIACQICGDLFKSSILLANHKQLHLNRKKHPCSVCNKGFSRPSDLKVHMRMHTGEEPFACHICDRRFKLRVRLTYHLQQHAGIKRKCEVCGKEFSHVKHLKNHSFKHTGMPYRCTVCKYACAQRDVFRKHILRMHNLTMTDAEYRAMFKANTGRNPRVKTIDELQLEAKNLEIE